MCRQSVMPPCARCRHPIEARICRCEGGCSGCPNRGTAQTVASAVGGETGRGIGGGRSRTRMQRSALQSPQHGWGERMVGAIAAAQLPGPLALGWCGCGRRSIRPGAARKHSNSASQPLL
jgi:hypothetical protein